MLLNITSSFWSVIVSCSSLILLFPNIASSVWLFRCGTRVSPDMCSPWSVSSYCSGSVYSIVLGLWLIYLSNFWKVFVSYFPFSQFPTIISFTFFQKFVACLVVPELLLHFRRVNPLLPTFISSQLFNFVQRIYIESIKHS